MAVYEGGQGCVGDEKLRSMSIDSLDANLILSSSLVPKIVKLKPRLALFYWTWIFSSNTLIFLFLSKQSILEAIFVQGPLALPLHRIMYQLASRS